MKKAFFFLIFCNPVSFCIAQDNGHNFSVKGINQISISVSDLEKSSSFYGNVIGLDIQSKIEINQILKAEKFAKIKYQPNKKRLLKSPNGFLELIEYSSNNSLKMEDKPIQTIGISHVCYQSPITNPIYENSKKNGAKIVSRGHTGVDRGFGIKYAYIRDPDGILFENEQFDQPKFTENHWIGHVAIATPNIGRVIDFYIQLLGSKPINRINSIKNNAKLDDIANLDSLVLSGAWFKIDNMLLEIWQFDNPKFVFDKRKYTTIGYQKIVFEVENLANFYLKMKDSNFDFLSKPRSENGTLSVFLRDPDGNLLLLKEIESGNGQSINNLKKLE